MIFFQICAEIDAKHLPKIILTPSGARESKGARGASIWGQLGGQFSQNLQSALWKVIFMSLLAHKWTITLASVHFVVRMLDQRINSSCWAWETTLTSFWGCYTSHFWGCFTPKDSQRAKTKVLKIQILVTLLQQMLHVWIGHGDEKRFTESTIKDGKVWPKNGTCRPPYLCYIYVNIYKKPWMEIVACRNR